VAPILPPGVAPAWRELLLAEGGRRRPLVPVPTVLTVFRLGGWEQKGLPVLLDAVDTARRAIGPVRVVVAGRGPAPGTLHELLAARQDVELIESPDDEALARLYSTADLFVLCTRTRAAPPYSGEGYGIVLLEAQLAGCAVVGPAAGGSHDAYQDGVTGTTPTDESPDALASVLLAMLADRARLARMGRRAAEWAEAATRPEDYTRTVFTALTGRTTGPTDHAVAPDQRRTGEGRRTPTPANAHPTGATRR
jgi:glycosyltransferase involved in cell wall biosynthesis